MAATALPRRDRNVLLTVVAAIHRAPFPSACLMVINPSRSNLGINLGPVQKSPVRGGRTDTVCAITPLDRRGSPLDVNCCACVRLCGDSTPGQLLVPQSKHRRKHKRKENGCRGDATHTDSQLVGWVACRSGRQEISPVAPNSRSLPIRALQCHQPASPCLHRLASPAQPRGETNNRMA
ncbi:hypothetical protein B0T10DRAFT_192270 [Thelonectria olida]|uniref:Uncharacterized protein n=1 Tax=Thelonectria olida TaxID=1576542 RepID=A0A9P9AKM1_9HYPO|nr:hypothetical protein B0T10DRAFT_192270 [Thelonectria olida]